MANAAEKKIRQANNKVMITWLIIAIIISGISAIAGFLFKVGRKPPPPKPRIRGQPAPVFHPRSEAPFWSGFIVSVIGLALVYNRIRFRKGQPGEKQSVPELSGPRKHFWLAFYLDVVGIGLMVQFVGIWWEKAYHLFWLVPVFIIYTCLKKLIGWFGAFT
jgi:hypothetical protein